MLPFLRHVVESLVLFRIEWSDELLVEPAAFRHCWSATNSDDHRVLDHATQSTSTWASDPTLKQKDNNQDTYVSRVCAQSRLTLAVMADLDKRQDRELTMQCATDWVLDP